MMHKGLKMLIIMIRQIYSNDFNPVTAVIHFARESKLSQDCLEQALNTGCHRKLDYPAMMCEGRKQGIPSLAALRCPRQCQLLRWIENEMVACVNSVIKCLYSYVPCAHTSCLV